MALPLVIDVGMYDGSDSEYYLSTGHRVIAIEANPAFVASANCRLARYREAGQFTAINAAIAPSRAPVRLALSGIDGPRASTTGLHTEETAHTITVDGLTMADVLALSPERPRLIKIDIEGADHLCLSALTPENRPDALSIEAHDGPDAILPILSALGYTRFKLIEQVTFRELSRYDCLPDRLARGISRRLGWAEPGLIRRGGQWFPTWGRSSGPAPWATDGQWRTAVDVSRQYAEFRRAPKARVWLDLHAM